jgi:glycosyltransferase involved in cell wall biosynthesis
MFLLGLAMNKPLSLMIDVSSIPYQRGVSRYTANLSLALAQNPDVQLTVFGTSHRQFTFLKQWAETLPAAVEKRIWPLPPSALHTGWQIAQQPLPWLGKKIDVFHAWDWQLVPVGKVPQVVTIHDLAYKLFPRTAHPVIAAAYDRLLQTLEDNPEILIIAVSESTKHDIVNLTHIAPDRIQVVYEALPMEAEYTPSPAEIQETLHKYQLTRPFLLSVGTTEPRKNLPRIIEAWRSLRDKFDLVVAGAAGWDQLDHDAGIHHLGFVAPRDLAGLYREAHALVFASLYEGFGLPILEAYYHHCPVVTSRVSAMAEIAGSPAVLVDPYDSAAIAEACLAIEEKNTQARHRRELDMDRVLSNYSWDKVARECLPLYRKAAQV